MSKLEAFFMDTKFNISLWKSSVLLPAFSISFVLILGLIIFISYPINWLYIQKKSPKINKGKFIIPLSFKTLYTISGAEFLIGGMIQGLIYVKGMKNIFSCEEAAHHRSAVMYVHLSMCQQFEILRFPELL